RATVSGVRIPPSPPLSCSELVATRYQGQNFLLFQRRLAEEAEPPRLAPGPISVSARPSASNRANLVRPGAASRRQAISASSVHSNGASSAGVLPAERVHPENAR